MAKPHLRLQHSESVVVQAAAQIYAAYISSGRVQDGDEQEWMKRSIDEATRLAIMTDESVISDEEIQSLGGQRQLGEK